MTSSLQLSGDNDLQRFGEQGGYKNPKQEVTLSAFARSPLLENPKSLTFSGRRVHDPLYIQSMHDMRKIYAR